MKQIFRFSFTLTFLCSSYMQSTVLPYLSIRSQSINDARELVGWQTQINKADMCQTYGSFSITPEYTRSFNSSRIAQALFCDALTENCCNRTSLKIQGSKVSDRNPKALMAENFYLPTDYDSIVTVNPKIDNFLVDFNMYLGLDGLKEGLFFRIHAPVVYTGWQLNYDETIVNAGTNAYDPGYFTSIVTNIETNPQGLPRTAMLNNFVEYASDGLSIDSAIGGFATTTFNPLESARWSHCRKTLTGLADLRMQLGWNILSCPNYHLGFSIQAAAPTGNRPLGQFLFEPIVGNGHHWELGGGMTFHTNICQNCQESCSWDLYLDANITHLFKARQCRTFDLCGKPLSRYMLASKFGNTTPTNLEASVNGAYAIPSAQFANQFTPVANITTIPVNVSAAVQSDIVLKLAWTHCNFQWDLGYNFWARSCEKISRYTGPCCYEKFPSYTYALKGNAFVYGFQRNEAGVNPDGIPLSATQSNATIFGSIANPGSDNSTIDNPFPAYISVEQDHNQLVTTEAGSTVWTQVNTSYNPVFIKEEDIDLASGQQRGISNKLFTHLGYTWTDHGEWIPFIGIGGEVEWGRRNHKSDCQDSCKQSDKCCKRKICYDTCCQDFALSQWGVWVKGGVSFN